MILAATMVVAVALAGCSGDDDGGGGGDKEGPTGSGGTVQEVQTNAKLGKLRGPLKKRKAKAAAAEVTAVVERWLDGSYGGDYPRTDFNAGFADFTKDARALARKQPKIMSNAKLGPKLHGVEFRQRVVRVDLVGPKGKPAGATARFRARFELTGPNRTDEVRGRLMLTPVKGGWKVFGFDVRREEGAR